MEWINQPYYTDIGTRKMDRQFLSANTTNLFAMWEELQIIDFSFRR